MCLIRVRREEVDEEPVHPRLANGHGHGHAVREGVVTTVITPIPPPPPPPPESVYSDVLVTTAGNHNHGHGNYHNAQSNYVYDVGSERLVEAEYRNADGYIYDADQRDGYRDQRSSGSEYVYSAHGGAKSAYGGSAYGGGSQYGYDDRDGRVQTTKTTIIKGGVSRAHSDAGRSRSHSRTRSYSGTVGAASTTTKTTKPDVILGPGGEPYVKTHRHRHRRRSGSLEREKSVTRFSHVDSPEARRAMSVRHSHVSVSNGRMSEVEMSEPRSSFRYIEQRGSAARGLESADMVRRREEERFAYGGMNPQRRSGSVTYAASESHGGGHQRSFSGGVRRSIEKVIVMDSRDYY